MLSSFIVIMVVILFTQMERKEKFQWKDMLKIAFIVGVIVLIGQPIMTFLKSKIPFTIPFFERVPENVRFLMGALVFFTFTCGFSIYGWKKFAEKNK